LKPFGYETGCANHFTESPRIVQGYTGCIHFDDLLSSHFLIFFAKTLPKQKIQGHCMQVELSTCNAAIQAAARAGDTGLAHEMLQEMRALDVRPVPRLTARGKVCRAILTHFAGGNGWKWYVVSSVPLVHVFASGGETAPVVVHVFENTHF